MCLFSEKRYKANVDRFQSVIVEGKALSRRRWCIVFLLTYIAIDTDMLKGRRLANRFILRTAGADVDAPAGSTAAQGVGERSIKSAAQNSLVISLSTMCEPKHHRMLNIIVHSSMLVTPWYQRQNVEQRDVFRGSSG